MKEKSNKFELIFIIVCMVICLIPLVGMTVFPTTETTENKTMAAFPALTAEGGVNLEFFEDFDDYFNEHFAFRNELVYADAMIQTRIFQVSNVDTVIYGTDGWLYYTATLDDYLGTDLLSEREIYNIAHNMKIVSNYLEEQGIDFVLAIPPNKNTLYGENMPYYDSYIADLAHNIDALTPLLKEAEVPYADLLELFRNSDETLYLKRDSHWNNMGALLAYNCIMDELKAPHDDYSDAAVSRAKDEDGDLNKMLYTFYGETEFNYKYDIEQAYTYADDDADVEDSRIETTCDTASGTLLMFRDSFANALIPFLANQFEKAYFTKGEPYSLESFIAEYSPDAVIFEKTERNIENYITMPPIISALEADVSENVLESETGISGDNANETGTETAEIAFDSLIYDADYYAVSGTIDESFLSDNTDIIVGISGTFYEAYHTGENGFELYIKKTDIGAPAVQLSVLTRDGDTYKLVRNASFDIGDF